MALTNDSGTSSCPLTVEARLSKVLPNPQADGLQDQTHHDRFRSSMLMRLLQRTEAGYSPMKANAHYNRKPDGEVFF